MVWLGFGSALLGSWDATLGDLVILVVGLLWLWVKPSVWPIAILGLYQLGSLGVNAFAIIEQPVGSMQHKALVVHIALRALALFYMCSTYMQTRSRARADS